MTLATLALTLFALPAVGAEQSAPVLLDFHASWCGPCQEMRPAIAQLIDKGYPVKSIDIDRSKSLAARYRVQEVPTFVVVDSEGRELARTTGLRPAAQLATLYKRANAKAVQAEPEAEPETRRERDRTSADDESENSDGPDTPPRNPDPWKTVVRIHIQMGGGGEGLGSGTIIYSSPEESIILTCAHIFHVDGSRQQYAPSQFARRISVDLFDGQLHSWNPAVVHPIETVAGKAIDYDFGLDVGLIRIRPGRKLPASMVVPPSWSPRRGMPMTTVGCSEGRDATAWSTSITNPTIRGMVGNNRYEAIECDHAPRQGRSGGGLYTLDGYIAGVCDFAEPRGRHGLYAAPRSIHRLLDKHNLTMCYNPNASSSDTLLAENRGNSGRTKLRAQNSPLPDSDGKSITVPEPELVGVRVPAGSAENKRNPKRVAAAWQSPKRPNVRVAAESDAIQVATEDSRQRELSRSLDEDRETPVEAEIQMEPSVNREDVPADSSTVANAETGVEPAAPSKPRTSGGWRPVRPVASASGATERR
jgi:hypothetical protein